LNLPDSTFGLVRIRRLPFMLCLLSRISKDTDTNGADIEQYFENRGFWL
jgi:hypothetical protein